jgi:hypothetical protein
MKYDSRLNIPMSRLWRSMHNSSDKLWDTENKGFVSLEDMNNAFMKPQTKGTGMSVALNMQQRGKKKDAEVMISHSWREDMVEVLNILKNAEGTDLKNRTKFGDETVIWFCGFSQYQPGNGTTDIPSVEQQIKTAPFEQVIESRKVEDMFVIQTMAGDPYSRMWCAVELGVALRQKGRVKIHPFFSKEWLNTYVYHGEEKKNSQWKNNTYVDQLDRQGELKLDVTKTTRSKNDVRRYYLMEKNELAHYDVNEGKRGGIARYVKEPRLKSNIRKVSSYPIIHHNFYMLHR